MKPSFEGADSEYNHLKAGMVEGIAALVYGQPGVPGSPPAASEEAV
jgi:hypothetical protein